MYSQQAHSIARYNTLMRGQHTHLDVQPILEGGHVVHALDQRNLLGHHLDGVDHEVRVEQLRHHGTCQDSRLENDGLVQTHGTLLELNQTMMGSFVYRKILFKNMWIPD